MAVIFSTYELRDAIGDITEGADKMVVTAIDVMRELALQHTFSGDLARASQQTLRIRRRNGSQR